MVGRRKRRRNERICVTLVCKSRHLARREHTCEIHDTVSCIQGDCVTRLTTRGASHASARCLLCAFTLPPVRLYFALRTGKRSDGPIFLSAEEQLFAPV